jgi:hypothetical protein
LLILYIFIFVGVTLSSALFTGNNQQVGWVFKTLPVHSPALYFKGIIKAAFARFFMPIYLPLVIILCSVWGLRILPYAAIALLAIYLFSLLFYYLSKPTFPFATEKMAFQGGAGFWNLLGLMVAAIVLGFLHKFLLHWFDYANLLLIPVYGGAILYVNRIFVNKRITWEAVDRVNNYS